MHATRVAYGVTSNATYTPELIWDGAVYPKMKAEVLVNDEDCIVIPIRNRKDPHFRRLGQGAFRERIGTGEPHDDTHTKVQKFLLKKLRISRLNIVTNVFEEKQGGNGEVVVEASQQPVFIQGEVSKYLWFLENKCRIPCGHGKYIQPDIAGRDPSLYTPTVVCPNVVIEVIQTHYPEEDTFFRLLELSAGNTLVVLYFVPPGKWESAYNKLTIDEGFITIQAAHYMCGGQFYKNGVLRKRKDGESDSVWYRRVESTYFRTAMEGKTPKPVARDGSR